MSPDVKKQEKSGTSIAIKFDEPLTSDSCSKIITELIKYILYQKQQIPLSFDTLMQLEPRIKPTDRNFTSTKTLFSTINNLTHQLSSQLHLDGCDVKEVVVVIGATIMSPKFCLRLELPKLILNSDKHLEYQHSYRKPLLTLMKSLVECTEFQDFMTVPLGLTNTFVLVNKSDSNPKSDFFLSKPQYHLPVQTRSCFSIKLNSTDDYSTTRCTCQNIVKVYNDNNEKNKNKNTKIITDVNNQINVRCCIENKVPYSWYQSKEVMKGFKFFR